MDFTQTLEVHVRKAVCLLFVLTLVLTMSSWAGSIYGGFEDRTTSASDYDYNDLVFTLTGANLVLVPVGANGFFTEPTLFGGAYPTHSAPFWNNGSQDGANINVGYCIYGGGACNGGVGLDPTALYLATANLGNYVPVSFTVAGDVDNTVTIMITADPSDRIGYNDGVDHFFASATGTFTFTPSGGAFTIIGENGLGQHFSSLGNTPLVDQQFAWFAPEPVPEPTSLLLLGSGLFGLATTVRRKLRK